MKATSVSVKEWIRLNAEIGALSFGGAGRILLFQEAVVDDRGWLSEEEFYRLMTVSQVLPGPNLVNLSVQLGLTLAGRWGAFLGVVALGLPGALVAVLFVSLINLEDRDIRQAFQGFSLASIVLFVIVVQRIFEGIRRPAKIPRSGAQVFPRLLIAAGVAIASAQGVPLIWTLCVGGMAGFYLEARDRKREERRNS